jgi:pimeloyl-ACP methyl ester carboxylesterase
LSHGAHVALALAARRPDQANRLVLCSIGSQHTARAKLFISSWLELLKKGDLESMARAILLGISGKKFLKENEKILEKMVKAIVLRNRREPLINHLEAILTYPSPSRLVENISHPCLFLSGAEDQMVSPGSVKYLADLCSGGYKEIEECGHNVYVEKPGVFNQLIFDFFLHAP